MKYVERGPRVATTIISLRDDVTDPERCCGAERRSAPLQELRFHYPDDRHLYG